MSDREPTKAAVWATEHAREIQRLAAEAIAREKREGRR